MRVSHPILIALAMASLAGCSFELPAPEPVPPSAVDLSHYEWFDNNLGLRYYDFNNQLAWIEHYVRDSNSHIIQTTHNNALDVTEYIDVMRWEPFTISGATDWRQTRLAHYLPSSPSNVLLSSQAWAYGADGNETLWAEFGSDNALSQYKVTWWDTSSPAHRLQESWFNGAGVSQGHRRYRFQDLSREWWNATDTMVVDASRGFGYLTSVDLDGAKRITSQYDFNGDNVSWARTTHDYVPSTGWEYYQTWSTASGQVPAAPTLSGTAAASPLVALGSPTTAPTIADSVFAAVTLPAIPSSPNAANNNDPQLLNWTSSLPPTSWTAQGGQFMLPGLDGGTTTIRYRMSTVTLNNPIPELIRWSQAGMADIETKLTYDAWDRLTERAVTYGGSPVLTVAIEREPGSGRITKVSTGGSWIKIPLDYKLGYPTAFADRPGAITVGTKGIDLITLDFTYGAGASATMPYGLQPLNLDNTIDAIDVAASGGTSKIPVLHLVLSGSSSPKTMLVYDVYKKSIATEILRGKVEWSIDTQQRKTQMTWTPTINNTGTYGTTTPFYQGAWGTYADIAADAASAGAETVSDLKLKAADLLSTVESFDIEKVFQFLNLAQGQFADYQTQYVSSAASLIERVKKASGH